MSNTTEQNARQMIELVNSRNVDKLLERFAEDATLQVPSMDAPLRGKEAIRAYFRQNFAAFPDWSMQVTKVIISGGETIIIDAVHGTHNGPLTLADGQSFAPTHKTFHQEQLTRVVFDNSDNVLSLRAYGNSTDVTRQLGLAA